MGLTIRVSIGSMALNGLTTFESQRFERSFRSELTNLFSSSAPGVAGTKDQLSRSITPGSPEAMGRDAARVVFDGVRNE